MSSTRAPREAGTLGGVLSVSAGKRSCHGTAVAEAAESCSNTCSRLLKFKFTCKKILDGDVESLCNPLHCACSRLPAWWSQSCLDISRQTLSLAGLRYFCSVHGLWCSPPEWVWAAPPQCEVGSTFSYLQEMSLKFLHTGQCTINDFVTN